MYCSRKVFANARTYRPPIRDRRVCSAGNYDCTMEFMLVMVFALVGGVWGQEQPPAQAEPSQLNPEDNPLANTEILLAFVVRYNNIHVLIKAVTIHKRAPGIRIRIADNYDWFDNSILVMIPVLFPKCMQFKIINTFNMLVSKCFVQIKMQLKHPTYFYVFLITDVKVGA